MVDNDRSTQAPDGTEIAYAVAGSGPALVLTNGLTTSSFFYKYVRPIWLTKYTVVTWDLPGHGRSQPARSEQSATIEGQPEIMARVMDAAGIASATQIGWSVGCQVVFEFARRYPGRTDALVALFGSYEHALSRTALPLPGSFLYAALRQRHGALFAAFVLQLARVAELPLGLEPLRRAEIIGRRTSDADARALIAHFRSIHPATSARMARSAEEHSAADMLRELRMPLLIVAGERDPFAPVHSVAEPLQRAVAHSVLVRLPEATHTALLDHAPEIASAVENFLSTALQ